MKKIATLILGLVICAAVFAQNAKFSGVIRDKANQPVVGAFVVQQGTTNGTMTDEEMWLLQAQSVVPTIGFSDLGCWGSFRMGQTGLPQIFINNGYDPQCYLTAVGEDGQILVASNVN